VNRTDRLVAIVMLLQSRRVITAAQLAAHFEVTERTIYRDLAALCEGGTPIVGEAGVGYSLMRGYQLPPVMFTPEEAMALVTSGALAERMTDESVRGAMRGALAKLTAILPASQQAQAHALRAALSVQSQRPSTGAVPLAAIQAATIERRVLKLHYHGANSSQPTQRDVEPLGLTYYLQQWHLIAWCRLRQETRDFRLDRIRRCEALPERAAPRPDFDLHAYVARQSQCADGVPALVRFRVSALEAASRAWGPMGKEISQDGEWVLCRLQTPSLEFLACYLLGFGSMAEALEPVELRSLVISAAREAIERHETPISQRLQA
jgi:predicted DNA-binding transcriptional regulator YafY